MISATKKPCERCSTIIPDVNILVYAFHSAAPQHKPSQQWLSGALNRHETIGLLDAVATGFVRVMTNHKLFHKPLTAQQALTALNAVLEAPNGTLLSSSPGTWTTFTELVRLHKLKASDIPDAWIAAAVIEEATLLSQDQGFARFRELRWHPLSD